MMPSVWWSALAAILLLSVAASIRVARWDLVTSAQKAAWLLLVWVVPILGASLALYATSEARGNSRAGRFIAATFGDPSGIAFSGGGLVGLDGAHHCSDGGHGGDGGGCGDGGSGGGH